MLGTKWTSKTFIAILTMSFVVGVTLLDVHTASAATTDSIMKPPIDINNLNYYLRDIILRVLQIPVSILNILG